MTTLTVPTNQRDEFVDITSMVSRAVRDSGVKSGHALVYVPHTTAGITINENADPDVVHDILKQLDAAIPWSQPFYRHAEDNSAAHIKASMMGSSVAVIVEDEGMVLGTWQAVYFCEFDGPRSRRVHVKVFGER